MRSTLLPLLLAGACSSADKKEEVEAPKAVQAPAPQGSSKLATIPLDESGNRYVIDPATRSCFLVIQDPSGPLAPARVSCARLRDNVPEAADHITWVTEAPEASAAPARSLPGAPHNPMRQEVIEGIRKVSDTAWEIERESLEKFLANPTVMARGARIVPSIKDGKPNGFRLYAIRPRSVYASLGLENGDTLQKANGMELSTPDKALEAYNKIRDAEEVVLDLRRRNKPRRHTYRIVR